MLDAGQDTKQYQVSVALVGLVGYHHLFVSFQQLLGLQFNSSLEINSLVDVGYILDYKLNNSKISG